MEQLCFAKILAFPSPKPSNYEEGVGKAMVLRNLRDADQKCGKKNQNMRQKKTKALPWSRRVSRKGEGSNGLFRQRTKAKDIGFDENRE